MRSRSPEREHVERDERRGSLGGESRHPALGGVDALSQRIPVQSAPPVPLDRDDDLAIEHTGREQPAEGIHEFGGVPGERLVAAAADVDTVGGHRHDAPEAVPLRLVEHSAFGQLVHGSGEHRGDERHAPILAVAGLRVTRDARPGAATVGATAGSAR